MLANLTEPRIRSKYSRVEVAEFMTADQFFEDAPEGQKAELINGVLYMMTPPSDEHEQLQLFLLTLIRLFVEENELGEVRGSRTAVQIDAINAYEPDIMFVARDREHIVQSKGVFGAPNLVVEILSPSTARHDRVEKMRAYERVGVREYWLIDPYGPSGTAFYQLKEGVYFAIEPDADGWIDSAMLPRFRLNVECLWPEKRFIKVLTALKAMI